MASLSAEELYQEINQVKTSLDTLIYDTNGFWLIFGSALVFFMQCGFALLETGGVRAKNARNILTKNVLDSCVGTIMWYFIGYGVHGYLATNSGVKNGFIGSGNFALYDISSSWSKKPYSGYADWLFFWAFAGASCTIVSGAVAERCQLTGYFCYTIVMTSIVHPVISYWVWGGGWLGASGLGFIDFAGSMVVHSVGGGCALLGAIFLKPRLGRFLPTGEVTPMPGHNASLSALGAMILWFCWYGFNCCSTLVIYQSSNIAAYVAITTTLSGAFGGLSAFAFGNYLDKYTDVNPLINGILSGLVAVTACPHCVTPWAAALIGTTAGLIYHGASRLLLRLKIDDPLDASPVHLFNGMWGIIAAGLFSTDQAPGNLGGPNGLFYGNGKQFLIQVAGLLSIVAYTVALMIPTFYLMNRFEIFRVSETDEKIGLDLTHHGHRAYEEDEDLMQLYILLSEKIERFDQIRSRRNSSLHPLFEHKDKDSKSAKSVDSAMKMKDLLKPEIKNPPPKPAEIKDSPTLCEDGKII